MSKAQGTARCLGWGVDKQLQEACLLWKRALEAILVLQGETGWVVAPKQLDHRDNSGMGAGGRGLGLCGDQSGNK